ncbi:MAG: hypothetical protein GF388_04975 [Candidatus Aegiribacteria sp.]|nr:hypothetical protein [Candidatus Aegiribacteria sp.]MBD3294573.1 hypothetical protein [Candidatus Fermentibacteria bacterium]
MVIVFLLLIMLVLEEILHRLNRGASFMDVDLAANSVEQVEGSEQKGLTRFLSWLRIVQLFTFGVLLAFIAASAGVRLLATAPGQLAGLLLLIQVVRILNRKVINQWSVLGMTVVLQVLLLLLLLFTGTGVGGFYTETVHGNWLVSLTSFFVLFLLTVTMPFTGTYFFRLLAREGSGFYYFLPSLAYSEYWIRRFTRVASMAALVSMLLVLYYFLNSIFPVNETACHVLIVLILFTASYLFRNRLKLHHPRSILLVLLAWIIRIAWLLGGYKLFSG